MASKFWRSEDHQCDVNCEAYQDTRHKEVCPSVIPFPFPTILVIAIIFLSKGVYTAATQCNNATILRLDRQILNNAAMEHVLNRNLSLIVKLQAFQSVAKCAVFSYCLLLLHALLQIAIGRPHLLKFCFSRY